MARLVEALGHLGVQAQVIGAVAGPKPSVPTARPRHEAASRHRAPARKGRTPAGSAGRMTSRAPAATSATGVAHATRPMAHVRPSTIACPASPPSQPA